MAFNIARTVSGLDRRVSGGAIASSYAGGTLTFTLPYKIAMDNSEGVLAVGQISTGNVIAFTRPAINQVAIVAPNTPADFYIGVLYTFSYRVSTLMLRASGRDGQPTVDTTGRLTIRYVKALFHDTTDLTITVGLDAGRPANSVTYRNPTPTVPYFLKAAVNGRNVTATIDLTVTTPGTCNLDRLEWAGTHATGGLSRA